MYLSNKKPLVNKPFVMKMFLLILLSFFYLAISSVKAQAEVFQYFDEEGTLIVTDRLHHSRRTSGSYRENINARPGYRDDVYYEFYEVSGKNFQELTADTQQKGPYDSRDKKKYIAQTRWSYGLSYAFDSTYRIESPYVYASVYLHNINFKADKSVLLPMLRQDIELSKHDGELWERFLQALLEHEHDHVKIVNEPLDRRDAESRISAIREVIIPYEPAVDIDSAIKQAVEAKTTVISHDIIKAVKERNELYDEITKHGQKPEMRNKFFYGY